MESILNTDLYKFTQQQFVHHYFPKAQVTYKFIDRNSTRIENADLFLGMLNDEISKITSVSLQSHERTYLELLHIFNKDYLDFLQNFKFDINNLEISVNNGLLDIKVKGLWLDTILWEVPLLAATTKCYLHNITPDINKHYKKLIDSRNLMGNLKFAEFGTRRRRNFEYQHLAVCVLKKSPKFIGTSNVYISMLENTQCLGTMAHELVMGHAGIYGVKNANRHAMYNWMELYQGKLGIALTDTYGSENFFQNFDFVLSRVYDGLRQDSGNPVDFAHRATKHYINKSINPAYKTILFSDGLTPVKCQKIESELDTPIQRTYCIGTEFTNDQKLNLVMKLDTVNGKHVCKIPDDFGKNCGDKQEIIRTKKILFL